ncbi:uncharacterized protein [Clytia hemisphaerica]|uniref:CxC3 like cysteine cluster domain-containing protein n=1 Tax=Clytia hemisphaerica TaxID=252671 RepID=A0A7M5V3X0_9CNID
MADGCNEEEKNVNEFTACHGSYPSKYQEAAVNLMAEIYHNHANHSKSKSKKKSESVLEKRRCPYTGKIIPRNPSRPRTAKGAKKTTEALLRSTVQDIHSQEHFPSDPIEPPFRAPVIPEVHSTEAIRQFIEMLCNMGKPKRKRKTWFARSQATQEEWSRKRNSIWTVMLANQELDEICNVCKERPAKIQCQDCVLNSLCFVCDDVVHTSEPCHDRIFQGKKLLPLDSIDEGNNIIPTNRFPKLNCFRCTVCGSSETVKKVGHESVVLITLEGRFDLQRYSVLCKDCSGEVDPFTLGVLLKSGYWPGSPNSVNYFISEKVFRLWDKFRKYMPGSSETSFLKTLNAISEDNGRKATIDPICFGQSFKEWCFWINRKDVIQEKYWNECPACAIYQHSCHVDGNCKLYRYKRAKRKRSTFYEDQFIYRNPVVASFIDDLYGTKKRTSCEDSQCGGVWTAAKNSKRKLDKLDETGLDVVTCRHVIAQKALNMFQGELFGYPMFLLTNFMVQRNITYCFADVMCKLWPFVVRNEPFLQDKIKPALSVMHAKGHALECQVIWSGEWIDGTARSTGEETEQLFSYLSRTGNTTKHQSPENREETLTELAFHWNKIKITRIVFDLKKRYIKNEKMISLVSSSKQIEDEEEIKQWRLDIQQQALGNLGFLN